MDLRTEMDLTTRPRDGVPPENCKMRVAKSVFSIRSLVDLGDAAEKFDGNMQNQQMLEGRCAAFITNNRRRETSKIGKYLFFNLVLM